MSAKAVGKIFVYNLPWTVNGAKLKNYFNKFGQVNVSRVVFDRDTGLSKGYGFVTFNNSMSPEAALNVKRHLLEGNIIFVKDSK